ncbi:thioredoxin-like protein [Acaromyces ingoldii]|uniref:Glutathione S-transferase kappa n=1 Tax=Acaromyces ingoldii TaxID=215250 RepID=A0A316YNP4_9BASI|nr:thioredoxin-like protein [Acaromyces ingoldii]PWN89673.1 thioredoxin-like protein [Acaromyces ingoldii]
MLPRLAALRPLSTAAMSAKKNLISFHYDVVSPWSLIAFEVLLRLRPAWDCDLDLRPMNQNYIMKFSQNKPPMFVPNKGAYMSLELRRAASLFGVEGLSMPSGFPVDTTGAQLVLRALKDASDSEALAQATRAFMSAVWKEDRPVKTAADIKAVLVDSKIRLPAPASTDLDAFIARALEKDSFARLKEETRILVEEEGAFGVPWIIVTRASDGRTEKWFGSDRFEQIAAFLGQPYKGVFGDSRIPRL